MRLIGRHPRMSFAEHGGGGEHNDRNAVFYDEPSRSIYPIDRGSPSQEELTRQYQRS